MKIFNFIVSSVIIAHDSVLSRISKTYLPISSLNVRELKLNYAHKTSQGKWEASQHGDGIPTPPTKP